MECPESRATAKILKEFETSGVFAVFPSEVSGCRKD